MHVFKFVNFSPFYVLIGCQIWSLRTTNTYMYLLDHLNKMSELLIHGLLAVPCGKRQVAGVNEVLRCCLVFLFFSFSFCVVEGSASWHPFAFPTDWLGFGGSRVVLPPLVVTAFTFSREFSGWAGIFPLVSIGIATTIWASCVSIVVLKLNWLLTAEVKHF